MTIREALDVSQRSVSFRDAEVLLAAALNVGRAHLHTHPEQHLNPEEQARYDTLLARREQNEPVAHIIGYKEFYGRRFKTDARALIPRPETEGLVECALAWCVTAFREHTKTTNLPCPLHIAELGTGSGNIAITLALELAAQSIPATIIAGEISPEALSLAGENWETLSQGTPLGNIQLRFVESDLFAHPVFSKRPFDLLIANLPYVEDTWRAHPAAQQDVVFYEPDLALFGGDNDGLGLYRRFFYEAREHLTPQGVVMIEYGETQTELLKPIIQASFPSSTLTVLPDYAGLDRVLVVRPELSLQ